MENSINIDDIIKTLEDTDEDNIQFEKSCQLISNAVKDSKLKIVNIAEHLNNLLTNTDPEKREKGTYILAQIIENLPHNLLTSNEISVLFTFFGSKLSDKHQMIPPTLKGILALTNMYNLPDKTGPLILTPIFENVVCQQQHLKERHAIYLIYENILKRNSKGVEDMGESYLIYFINAMESERDPRMLMLLFEWIPKMLKIVKTGYLYEELFDVLACYFPVEFNGYSGEKITRENLVQALGPCLCAVPEFAEFCIPLINEKLSSSLKIAKLDSLELLRKSCKIFPADSYVAHFSEIMDRLKQEILYSNDSEVQLAGLKALKSFTACILTNSISCESLIAELYDNIKPFLYPSAEIFIPSTKFVLTLAESDKISCRIVRKDLIPLIMNRFNELTDNADQIKWLEVLLDLLKICISVKDVENIMDDGNSELKYLPDWCIGIAHTSNVSEIRSIAIQVITVIARTFPTELRFELYDFLRQFIMKKECKEVRKAVLDCLLALTKLYSKEVKDFILTVIDIDMDNLELLNLYLETLSVVVVVANTELLEMILAKFVLSCKSNCIKTRQIACSWVKNIVVENHKNDFIQTYFNTFNILKTCYLWITDCVNDEKVTLDYAQDLATIFRYIIAYQDDDFQNTMTNLIVQDFWNRGDKLMFHGYCVTIILTQGLLERTRPQVNIVMKYKIILQMINIIEIIPSSVYLYICKTIAGIINKAKEDEELEEILNQIMHLSLEVKKYNRNFDNIHNIDNMVMLISWVTKALLLRGMHCTDLWIDTLISLLDHNKLAPKAFELIMNDSDECLSAKSYCNIRLLYKQKFFLYVSEKLSTNYTEDKPYYLTALGYLIKQTPKEIIIMYFKKILRLLLFCLEREKDAEPLLAVLETILTLIQIPFPCLEQHIDEILVKLLTLTRFSCSKDVRLCALNCIYDFPNKYPVHKFFQHKQQVLSDLLICTDDKKRIVRYAAVRTRSRWIYLDKK